MILVFCVSVCVCVSVQPEISGTGGRIATPITPSWRAFSGNLYKLLFEPIRRAVQEWKPLEIFRQVRQISEREVVSPRCLHHLEELRLASSTNWVSSLYDSPIERKSLWNFFASYVLNSVPAQLLFRLPWAGWSLPTTTKPLEHSQKIYVVGHALHFMSSVVALGFYVNGLSIINSTKSWLLDKRPTRSWTGYV